MRLPAGARQAIENMAAPSPVLNIRMVEVARGIVHHPKPLHHAQRAVVIRRGEGDDLPQDQSLVAKLQRRFGRLGRIAMAPRVERKPPADFDAGREMRLEAWTPDTAETDERR